MERTQVAIMLKDSEFYKCIEHSTRNWKAKRRVFNQPSPNPSFNAVNGNMNVSQKEKTGGPLTSDLQTETYFSKVAKLKVETVFGMHSL